MLLAKEFTLLKADHSHYSEILDGLKTFYIHQHLDWENLSEQVESESVFLYYVNKELTGILSIAGFTPANQWVKVFAVRNDSQKRLIWNKLLPFALSHGKTYPFYTITFWDWYRKLIRELSGFRLYEQIVALEREEPIQLQSVVLSEGTRIRSVTDNDVEHINDIDQLTFDPPWQLGKTNLTAAITQSKIKKVICNDVRILGYLLADYDNFSAHLSRIAIHPEWTGRGLASHLMKTMLNKLHKQRVYTASVNTQESNSASIRLYRKFGFQPTGDKIPVYQYLQDNE